MEELVWYLVVGGVAGFLAGSIVKGGGFGIVGNVAIGIVGGVLGGFLFKQLGLSSDGGLTGQLVTSLVGAVVLLVVVGLFRKGKGK